MTAVQARRKAMEIIPVIDLKDGLVVHARRGERDRYRPIETPLAPSSRPTDVVRGLRSLHPFDTVYVADLDAIMGRGDHDATVRTLKQAFPDVTFWVDNGVADVPAAERWLAAELGHLVLGSESLTDADVARRFAADERVILSLDFRDDAFQGPAALLAEPEVWPQRVIVMTLARVGSGAGPDLERLRSVRTAAARRAVYAAGGVRDLTDLLALAERGLAGALVATALHEGRLRGTDMAQLRPPG
jgi:phosphoribosylformimino-5-aminoimidazole carboxamide ribotide isomerase